MCFSLKYDVFWQCQWDPSCRSRRELSNAIVKSDFRLTGVEIWPFPFRKGVFKGSLGVPGAPWGVPGGSPGVPGTSLGGSKASLGVGVSATDRFVMYTKGNMMFLWSPRGLRHSLADICKLRWRPFLAPNSILRILKNNSILVAGCWEDLLLRI